MKNATVTVLYFGDAMDVTGIPEETLSAGDTSSLSRQILEKHPAMRNVRFRMALNRTLIKEESPLNDNDIVAILPPFRGG